VDFDDLYLKSSAPFQGESMFDYASDSNGAKDYEKIVEEIITKLN
tara:strand:- start:3279 stop:3413 length:135 start_codon:yes stop_codon:yes gene_type:complete